MAIEQLIIRGNLRKVLGRQPWEHYCPWHLNASQQHVLNHWLSQGSGVGNPWFVAFSDFHGVNTPTIPDFRLSWWCHWTWSWKEMWLGSPKLVWAGFSIPFIWLQDMTKKVKIIFTMLLKCINNYWLIIFSTKIWNCVYFPLKIFFWVSKDKLKVAMITCWVILTREPLKIRIESYSLCCLPLMQFHHRVKRQ